MKDEQLTALGISLRKDFQTLITEYATGWYGNSYLTDEDLQDLYAIGTNVRRLVRIGFDFAELEEALTSGFFPADLAMLSNKTDSQMIEEYPATSLQAFGTLSSQLSPGNSAQQESSLEQKSKKRQTRFFSETGETVHRDVQEIIGRARFSWSKNSYLREDDLQDFRGVGNDVEQLMRTGSDFAEFERSLLNIPLLEVPYDFIQDDTDRTQDGLHQMSKTSSTLPWWEGQREREYIHTQDLKSTGLGGGGEEINPILHSTILRNKGGITDKSLLEESALSSVLSPSATLGIDSVEELSKRDHRSADVSLSHSALKPTALRVDSSPLEGGQGVINDQNYPRLPEEKPFSPWKQEEYASIKGLKEFIRVLESEQQRENPMVFEADSPSYSEKRERIPGPSIQVPQNYRKRGIVSESEEQGLNRVLETELSANSGRNFLLPMLEEAPLNAQKPEIQGEFLRGTGAFSSSFQKQKNSGETELSDNKDQEDTKLPDDIAELDIEQIMEALTEEIYREYIRFYGK